MRCPPRWATVFAFALLTKGVSECRQSAVTLHLEASRIDTTRRESEEYSIGNKGTYRPRSRPAWFSEKRGIRIRIPLGSHFLSNDYGSFARP